MQIIIGSEALAAGHVTRYELTADYRRVLPDVYVLKRAPLTLVDHIRSAWLWSHRRAIVCGVTASALHGARWVDEKTPIELNLGHNKAPGGVIVRRDTLLEAEVVQQHGMPVTSIERTAFDLARRGPVGRAVQRLDALANATHFKSADVLAIGERHPRLRGLRRLPAVLDLVDAGAQSPKETWLRMLLIAAGFPRPRTQIPVPWPDGYPRYFLDMGWEEFMTAVEYDGQHHRTDPVQYRNDVARSEYVTAKGWRRIAVLAGDREADIVRRVERLGVPRAWSGIDRSLIGR